ncbi:MAG: phosphate signaling complex protein PhoU [Sedimentisphaerales bacterium]|nr:phosphate signaling complex protein PhoU [Sedimentisphaerales bacterium]
MSEHLRRAIENLKTKLLNLCSAVEEQLFKAVKSIQTQNAKLARDVVDLDSRIDGMEVDIEEECLKLLALHQPVAIDLRFIVTVLKINNDLERIGDLAVNIAERGEFLAKQEKIDVPFDFETMADKTQIMLRMSLDALVKLDCAIAHKVLLADDEVDAINRQMYQQVKETIINHPEWTEIVIHLLSVSRHLERIADHATNIAEDVIYMAEGYIVRHRTEQYK